MLGRILFDIGFANEKEKAKYIQTNLLQFKRECRESIILSLISIVVGFYTSYLLYYLSLSAVIICTTALFYYPSWSETKSKNARKEAYKNYNFHEYNFDEDTFSDNKSYEYTFRQNEYGYKHTKSDKDTHEYKSTNDVPFVDKKEIEYLKILELTKDKLNQTNLKINYHKLAKKFHPDINPAGLIQMQKINEAYKYLLNKVKKNMKYYK